MEFKTKRVVNPLEPIYKGVNHLGEQITYGKIKGNKPKRLHPVKVNKVESMFLNTGDIKGAQTFTLSDKFYKKKTRKDFRRNTFTDDIPGAQAGTLKRGITTKRCSNPIMPNYIPLGTLFSTSITIQIMENNLKSNRSLNKPKMQTRRNPNKLNNSQKKLRKLKVKPSKQKRKLPHQLSSLTRVTQ